MTTTTGLDRRQLLGGMARPEFRRARYARRVRANGAAERLRPSRHADGFGPGRRVATSPRTGLRRTAPTIQWTTFDTGPLQERLFREASLSESTVDVGFVLNTQVIPRAANLFEPLDDYLRRDPIEDAADIFPGLIEGMKVGGKQLAIPFRHASSGLHYNEELLAEKGFSKPPETIEEMIEIARACTYRRSDGTAVVGLCMPGVTYPNVIDLARAWDGDFITPDFKCVADQPPMLNAIKLLRALFEAGSLPPQFRNALAGGRQRLDADGSGRDEPAEHGPQSHLQRSAEVQISRQDQDGCRAGFEDAGGSLHRRSGQGRILGTRHPEERQAQGSGLEFHQGHGLQRRQRSRPRSTATVPVRASTYADAAFSKTVPYAAEELKVLKVARVPLPAFDEAARAGDFFKEEAEAAVLGMKTPEAAMTSLVKRVQPLLPN